MKKLFLAALAGASLFSIGQARADEGLLNHEFYGSLSGGYTITRDSNWDASGASGNI
jgi:hypothetical protein